MNWKLFFLTFGMLFLAEIGDKTQLAVFTLVAQYKAPVPIFLGASLALVTVTFVGAAAGQFVSRYIPTSYLQAVAGVLFMGMGALILWNAASRILGRG
ncbi:MAG TPA: TMEM165/GDT1 family protein [Firmicutes bacterium]|nr:TMEM165/GDT1 family protein [Bacillota bacterium]